MSIQWYFKTRPLLNVEFWKILYGLYDSVKMFFSLPLIVKYINLTKLIDVYYDLFLITMDGTSICVDNLLLGGFYTRDIYLPNLEVRY